MMTNATSALMKSPYRNLLWLTVKYRPEKSGLPNSAAMKGVIRSLTKAAMTVPKATPMTMPTAMSTRLPRSRKVLKPLPIPLSFTTPTFLCDWRFGPPAIVCPGLAQEQALSAPQPLDQLLPRGGPLLARGRPGELGKRPIEAHELEDMATVEIEGPLAHSLLGNAVLAPSTGRTRSVE